MRALTCGIEDTALTIGDRGGAASVTKTNTCRHHLLPCRLLKAPPAIGRKSFQVSGFVLAQIQNSCGDWQIFPYQCRDICIVSGERMLDIVDACLDRPFETVASIRMGCDKHPEGVRFFDR